MVDQQCSTVGGLPLNGIGTHEPAGQLFNPSQKSVVGFSIYVQSLNTAATTMTASLRLGGIGGAIVGSYAFTIPGGFGAPIGNWLLVQFPSGIQVTPGVTYAIDLTDTSGSSGIVWSACSSPYAGGCGYSSGECVSANSWAFMEYAGDFSIGLSSSTLTLAQGTSGSVTVDLNSINDFASAVNLSFSGPPGVSASFFGNPVTPSAGTSASSTLTIFVPTNVAVGIYTLTISGSSGPISHSATLTLNVISGSASDFSTASSGTVLLTPGSIATIPIVVASFGSFNSSVALSASWSGSAPSGVTFALANSVTPPKGGTATSTLTITAGGSAASGTYTIIVTGTSGTLAHATAITVVIGPFVIITTTTSSIASGFSIGATSTAISITQGLSGSTTIIVTSLGGFSSSVTLTASWVGNAPAGVSFDLPSPITPPPGGAGSSPAAITTTSTASTGSFTLRITGTSQSSAHSVDIIIQIIQPGPRCIIATATYGSELAPEVQLLRNFRDGAILRTQAGSSFMTAFNEWYYSFSPYIANYLSSHSTERTVMKGVLYPLVGILALSYATFTATSAFPEFAALLAGLLASSMIGAFYVGLPIGLLRIRLRRFRKLSHESIETLLGIAVLCSLAGLNAGELSRSTLLLTISTASVILSMLFLSAHVTSNRVTSLITHAQSHNLGANITD